LPYYDHPPRRVSPQGEVTPDSSTKYRVGEEKSK
jgi:hypothetical protein